MPPEERAPNERPSDDAIRLLAILESMEDGVVVQDRNGNVVSTNAAAERILQVSAPFLEDQSAFGPPIAPLVRRDGSEFPNEERPAVRVFRTGKPVTNSVMGLRRADGRTTWISTNATPLRTHADGPIEGVVLTIRDISEQVRLQDELEASLEQFRSLVASMPVGVAVSHGTTMRLVNRALVEILGYDDAAELEGRETLSLVHPNSERAVLERYAAMAQGQRPGPGILECRRKDGSSVLLEVTSMPLTFEGKSALLAIVRDVTESARARRAQELSERRFRALVDFAPVGIFETNTLGQCIYVNERVAETTGLKVHENLGDGWMRAVHPDDIATLRAKRDEARAAGVGLAQDLRFVTERGVVHAQVRSLPLVTDGVVTGSLGALVDLTELRTAELALASSEASFRTLTDRAPVGIGVRVGTRVVFANPALARMLGRATVEELLGADVFGSTSPSSREALRERFERLERREKVPVQIFSFQKSDGNEALLEIDSLNIDFRGAAATMSLVRDVTELERTRAERDAAHAALVESLGQKDTLLKEIHHRVKNNLQVIASLLRLGRRAVGDGPARTVFDDSIARVHSIALIHERLYQSVDLSRIEMASYLDGLVAELVRANTTPGRVRVTVQCERLFFDMDRCVPIGLIVTELVINALKHAFNGVGAGRQPAIVVSLRESARGYELEVSDNGVGIAREPRRHGSLGLRLVTALARQLCGTHEVDAREGTHWSIVFPAAPASARGG